MGTVCIASPLAAAVRASKGHFSAVSLEAFAFRSAIGTAPSFARVPSVTSEATTRFTHLCWSSRESRSGTKLRIRAVFLELGMSTGAALIGRHRIGDAYPRHLGSGLEVGGYAAARVPWFRLAVSAVRLPSGDDLPTPVRVLDWTLCALASPIAICGDARLSVADEITYSGAPISSARSAYAGLAVGLTNDR